MKNPKQQQQGDVWIERIEALPDSNLTKRVDRHHVLAEGEHTGHYHRLECSDVDTNVSSYVDSNGNLFLELKEDCTLVHEEHLPQVLSAGFYKFGQIHEYDYEKQESVPVFD